MDAKTLNRIRESATFVANTLLKFPEIPKNSGGWILIKDVRDETAYSIRLGSASGNAAIAPAKYIKILRKLESDSRNRAFNIFDQPEECWGFLSIGRICIYVSGFAPTINQATAIIILFFADIMTNKETSHVISLSKNNLADELMTKCAKHALRP